MFKAETVYVHEKAATRIDPFGASIAESETLTPVDVLVYDGNDSNITENTRPDGRRIAYGLHFPKTWSGLLDGKQITVRGEVCKVVGAPRPKTPENVPGKYNMVVEVERGDG